MKKFLSSFCYIKNGFSLMEMMIVLLVVAIIAAATAPMIAKKSARSGGNGSAISYLGLGSNFGNPNANNNSVFVLGSNNTPENNARMFLNHNTDGNPHIILGINGVLKARLFANDNNGIAFGNTNNNPGQDAIEIGSDSNASHQDSIAIGNGATADGQDSVAIGFNANTHGGSQRVSITTGTDNSAHFVGNNEIVLGDSGTIVRIPGRLIPHEFDIPQGEGNIINLGNENTTVNIPGNLAVMSNTLLGGNGNSHVYMNVSDGYGSGIVRVYCNDNHLVGGSSKGNGEKYCEDPGCVTKTGVGVGNKELKDGDGNVFYTSDRRLKKVGKPFTGGLEELKKLDFYNFTFKSDKDKTPQVGVIAQDLQKVFPNAVWEGSDKYLRIRWDEMFFAVINAVKELDVRVADAFKQINTNKDEISKLKAQIKEQQEIINELKNLEQRVKELEKNKS